MNGTGDIINNRTITGNLEISKDIKEPMFSVRISIGNPFVAILTKSVDVCKFQKLKKKSPLMVLFVEMLRKNFGLGDCPFKKVCAHFKNI